MVKKQTKKPAAIEAKRPRGRPKAAKQPTKLVELRLRDLLEQIEADSPPPIGDVEASLEIQTLKAPQVLRMIATGQAVVIGRGFLRRMIADLRTK